MELSYYKLNPKQIVQDIFQKKSHKIIIYNKQFFIFPHVYPSDKFRSSRFILENLDSFVKNARVCDMGCGMGVVGQFALMKGAKRVVQADINLFAVRNAKANRTLHKFSRRELKIYESDCFDRIPKQIFDIIIFNIPFHSEPHEIKDPLERAFHDPGFETLKKFLNQATGYVHEGTRILIAFSNKGDVKALEDVFNHSAFNWDLWRATHTDEAYDSRIYQLTIA